MGIQIEPDQDHNMQYTGVAKNASKINSYDEYKHVYPPINNFIWQIKCNFSTKKRIFKVGTP